MHIIVIIVLSALSIFLFYASYSISSGIYIKSLCKSNVCKNSVALTFDDGIGSMMTPKVLAVLKKHQVKATFFIIGEKVSANPALLKEIVKQGHSIGNHSFSHKWSFPMQSAIKIQNEIKNCSEALESVTGEKIKLFRPPFGVTNPMIAKAVKNIGLTSVGWSIRSYDTMGHDISKVTKRVSDQLEPGKVILLHDNRPKADLLLDQIILRIKNKGLNIITIDELFKI